jgi:hypothetical protein
LHYGIPTIAERTSQPYQSIIGGVKNTRRVVYQSERELNYPDYDASQSNNAKADYVSLNVIKRQPFDRALDWRSADEQITSGEKWQRLLRLKHPAGGPELFHDFVDQYRMWLPNYRATRKALIERPHSTNRALLSSKKMLLSRLLC